MNTKKTIRKILFVGVWLTIGSGMLILLLAAMGKQKRDTCQGYVVSINASEDALFLDESDLLSLLQSGKGGKIKGRQKSGFNLLQMEALLEDNRWVKDAQLYFDHHDVLHINVTERVPVARIFAGSRSFYLDKEGKSMQLSDKISVNVPVFTGYPDKKMMNASDSILLDDVISTARFIGQHKFWQSQVAQVDIQACGTDCWEFEIVPLIGNHIIKLGSGERIEEKLDRLYTFYKTVLMKVGFDRYRTIDLRFAGQIVAGRSENPKVDSIQLRKNVERLLGISETEVPEENNPVITSQSNTTRANPTTPERPAGTVTGTGTANPNPTNRSPKAVMRPREDR